MDVRPGYKMTEVGVIPEDWDVLSLGMLFSFKNGLNKGKEFFGHGKLIVNYMDVYGHSGLRCADIEGRVDVSRDELDAFNVRRGDVFFTRTSETVDEVGIPSVLLDDSDETVFSGFILRARPKNDALVDQFKRYCFLSRVVRNQIISKSTYTTRALTNGRVLSGIKLPTPKIKAEQSAIATALSDTDALIESLEKLIAKKRQIKRGAMQELLTGKRRLPGFTGEWTEVILGRMGRCRRGVSYNPTAHLLPFDTESTVRLLRANNVQDARVVLEDVQYVDSSCVSADQRLQENDILICMASGSRELVGKAGKFSPDGGFEYTFGEFMGCFRPTDQAADSDFVYYLFQTEKYRAHIAVLLAGSSINNLTPGNVETFLIRVPLDKAEQSAIAAILSKMDVEITALEAKCAKAQQIKLGIMHELLTGRIRLVEPKNKVLEAPC